jgi:WhiB family transcriptional regulator, redox-sensing transcriptional regulator
MTRRRSTSRPPTGLTGSPVVVHDMLAVATPGLGSDPESVTAWMAEGSCRVYPPNKFFPSDGAGVERARKICAACPVTEQCLDYALEHRIEHGVWGGCSERERRRILKRRRIEVSSD